MTTERGRPTRLCHKRTVNWLNYGPMRRLGRSGLLSAGEIFIVSRLGLLGMINIAHKRNFVMFLFGNEWKPFWQPNFSTRAGDRAIGPLQTRDRRNDFVLSIKQPSVSPQAHRFTCSLSAFCVCVWQVRRGVKCDRWQARQFRGRTRCNRK